MKKKREELNLRNEFGMGNLQPASCDPRGPEKLQALSSAHFAPERQNLGAETHAKIIPSV